MVSKCLWQLALASVALLFSSASTAQTVNYVKETSSAIQAFNKAFYNQNTGLWDAAWWNSANAVHILSLFALLEPAEAARINISSIIHNTYVQAQKTSVQTMKTIDTHGMIKTFSRILAQGENESPVAALKDSQERPGRRVLTRGFNNFLNDFYDDEGWWTGGLICAYDATRNADYLQSAVEIFADMQNGGPTPCNGGGIYWDKKHTYVNAIPNELYFYVAACLARRVSIEHYLPIAEKQWAWFKSSGMINGQNLVNDGLDANCQNNHMTTWSYNQGVILGGLAEMYLLTGDVSYLSTAVAIANAAIDALSNADGILVEADHCELRDGCGMDGAQFKGIFVRYLAILNKIVRSSKITAFIEANARSIWDNDRNQDNLLGVAWTGPYINTTGPADSSALDALVAALVVHTL